MLKIAGIRVAPGGSRGCKRWNGVQFQLGASDGDMCHDLTVSACPQKQDARELRKAGKRVPDTWQSGLGLVAE